MWLQLVFHLSFTTLTDWNLWNPFREWALLARQNLKMGLKPNMVSTTADAYMSLTFAACIFHLMFQVHFRKSHFVFVLNVCIDSSVLLIFLWPDFSCFLSWLFYIHVLKHIIYSAPLKIYGHIFKCSFGNVKSNIRSEFEYLIKQQISY